MAIVRIPEAIAAAKQDVMPRWRLPTSISIRPDQVLSGSGAQRDQAHHWL